VLIDTPDETTLTGQITAVNLIKIGSGVGIIAPITTTNSVSTSVDIKAAAAPAEIFI
jgi:hypothetical protein